MQFRQLLPLASAGAAAAMNLTEALNSQNATLSTLNGLLAQNPDLVKKLSAMSNITLLAPNNDAIKQLTSNPQSAAALADAGTVTALLTYHVLTGTYYASNFTQQPMFITTLLTNQTFANVSDGQRVEAQAVGKSVDFISGLKQKSTVTEPNVNFTGGTIHIINNVLTLPVNVSSTATASNLTALAGALRTANLETSLAHQKDVTIFAPSNEAFNAVGSVVDGLSAADLAAVLGYHVVEGILGYSSTLGNTSLRTTNGNELRITVEGGGVFVNAARVTTPDVLISNGVVHVINQVLNPNNGTQAPNPSQTGSPGPAYSGATSVTAGVPFTSGVTTPVTVVPTAAPTGTEVNAAPAITGAMGAAALFGAGAVLMGM